MADKLCEDACKAAYTSKVAKYFDLLCDCLGQAQNDAERKVCLERFRRGMEIAREARAECAKLCE
jgi:hypothetical protein